MKTAVIMLAGGLRPGTFQRQIGFPTAGMPLEMDRTLLQAWIELVGRTSGLAKADILIACNNEADRAWFAAETRRIALSARCPRVLVDPRARRGVAGVLADLIDEASGATSLVVLELNSLPPACLKPLVDETSSIGAMPSMCVGVGPDDRWAGVYRLDTELLQHVTSRGYVDLKEQFIPQLRDRGYRVDAAEFSDTPVQISDRRDYLRAIRIWRSRLGLPAEQSEHVSGFSVVCPGVDLQRGSHIADSVVLPGVVLGEGAVVARSIIGPMIHVPAGAVIVDALLADPSTVTAASDGRLGAVAGKGDRGAAWKSATTALSWSVHS